MREGADQVHSPFGTFLRQVRQELTRSTSAKVFTTTEDRSGWRRLFDPVTPVPGESLRSIVARSCRANHLPNSFGLLQHLGLVHRNRVNVSEDPNIDPAQLAWAMRVEEAEVAARRYAPKGRGHIDFFGIEVGSRRIEASRRRFSPIALGIVAADRPAHHRAVWELRDVPFCLEGWDMLQDRCHCEKGGILQGWSRTADHVDECDRCGDPLTRIEPIPVPDAMRPALSILRAIIPPVQETRATSAHLLPEPLRTADRSSVFRMITRLADAIDPNASDHPAEDAGARLHALHAACDAVRNWPRGLEEIRLPPRSAPSAADHLARAWRKLAHSPVRPARGRGTRGGAEAPVGIRRATEIARLSPEVLTDAWAHGLLTRHERSHGQRTLPAFSPAELVRFGQAWRDRREPDSLAHELGLPRYGVEQIAATRRIVADAPAVPGTGPHFTPAAVRSFLDALDEAAQPLVDEIPLKLAMRFAGGRMKPWGAVFDLLLNGRLPFDLDEGTRLLDRIRIPWDRAFEIANLSSCPGDGAAMVVQNDALEILNASGDLDHLLSELPAKGRNPKYYLKADVELLADTIVTIPEIAARMWLNPASAYQELRRRKLAERGLQPGAWPRTILAELD